MGCFPTVYSALLSPGCHHPPKQQMQPSAPRGMLRPGPTLASLSQNTAHITVPWGTRAPLCVCWSGTCRPLVVSAPSALTEAPQSLSLDCYHHCSVHGFIRRVRCSTPELLDCRGQAGGEEANGSPGRDRAAQLSRGTTV